MNTLLKSTTIRIQSGNRQNEGGLSLYPGSPQPLGAHVNGDGDGDREGVQFSIFSRHARQVTLLLFAEARDSRPRYEIVLSPEHNKTGDYWHITIENLHEGQHYLYRMDGPDTPGFYFDAQAMLIDPYARALSASAASGDSADPQCLPPKCRVCSDHFDWQGDRALNYRLQDTIIYETHVKGLTCHPSSARYGVKHPGTFRGVIEMIPYLKDLGMSSLELLPVQEFNEYEYAYRKNPLTGEALTNYWGYSTLAFFAPKAAYSSSPDQVGEFREMVRELHRAGIELILDIAFNHSGEGDHQGPTLSFRGIDNPVYYMLEDDPRFYRNYSGCGNTLNCNHSVLRRFILDVLRYWVQQMHVDGFRFDLAAVLGRDEQGEFTDKAVLLREIAEDPILQNSKIIAEPWDAGGAYRLGRFPQRWSEWNDRYRDDVKMFWRGNTNHSSAFATRLFGSADIFTARGKTPVHSINYITSHDGFTLNDLVSYNRRHNEANGEENRDGHNNELSYNCGHEGSSENRSIEMLRSRMVKNFLATLLLSCGTPMILGGDEMRRSQEGNNNAYCQDNIISWYNYDLLDQHADIHRFLRHMITFRKNIYASFYDRIFEYDDKKSDNSLNITWYDEHAHPASWNGGENLLVLKMTMRERAPDEAPPAKHEAPSAKHEAPPAKHMEKQLLILFNASAKEKNFILPETDNVSGECWYRVADTSLPSPRDIFAPSNIFAASNIFTPGAENTAENITDSHYQLKERSLAIFMKARSC